MRAACSPTRSSSATRSRSASAWRTLARERAGRRRRLPRHQLRARRRLGGRAARRRGASCSGTATASVRGVDAVVVPGGFAHGDYLRTGAIARFSPVMDAVAELRGRRWSGRRDLQRLPGAHRSRAAARRAPEERGPHVPVRHRRAPGRDVRDRCSPTWLGPGASAARPDQPLRGQLRLRSRRRSRALRDDDRIVLRYVDNPNGSLDDIAGISNEAGNVVGSDAAPRARVATRSSAPPTASCCCGRSCVAAERRRRRAARSDSSRLTKLGEIPAFLSTSADTPSSRHAAYEMPLRSA